MDTPATPASAAPVPQQGPSLLQLAWPRPAQLSFAFLLGALLSLLAVHAYGYLRWGTRPAELERGLGIAYRIDLNQATRVDLLQLPGIGDSLARRIEEYRLEHGRFRQVNDLIDVHGIGPATLERLRPWVQVKLADGDLARDEDVQKPRPVPNGSRREPSGKIAVPGKMQSQKEASLTAQININRATPAELQRLPGVGPKMSQRIVDERERAPFQSVDDLRRVPGIGPKTLERLRPYVTVNPDSLRVASTEVDADSSDSP